MWQAVKKQSSVWTCLEGWCFSFFASQWNILAISVLSHSLRQTHTHAHRKVLKVSVFALTWFWRFSHHWEKMLQHGKIISFSAFMIYKNGEREEALHCHRSPLLMEQASPCHPCSLGWTSSICFALCCCWLRQGLVWPTFNENFAPNFSTGWLLAFRGALPIGNTKQQIWGGMWAAWVWTEVLYMLSDAVLTRTVPWAESATASVSGCVILANLLQVFNFFVDWSAPCCANNIKARSTAHWIMVYFIRLAQTSSYLLLWGNLNWNNNYLVSFAMIDFFRWLSAVL